MSLRLAKASVVATILAVALAGCSSSTALVTQRTQGYVIPSTALQQIRPGQSQQTVQLVLGSPQSTNTFGDQTAWYYVETKVNQTSFGFTQIKERTVLAVYFDKSKKVSERAVYSLQDGRAVDIETRRTPSFGQDATFIDSILSSF
ncbi:MULTISPECIES: outer membrane protein assembly factor BamE [unclassified Devosia]|uniref:outer membrane protein assembly factor BamE n=1 Tax=unclassified Devosia TaxID=196773 RepID=UPI00145D8825|nr:MULTISPECIES: outer membrane protein assembly factor BamE [unclassified Devosia]MBJ6986834.1 outer membrane protein assembly factor BamE [Devosia sp. MC521]MBJ7576727.1 outer membrane protein assembly factor BamE [Devosia sp. MC532]MBK1795669.1 outer membrane protein assembly factor BamE [Devosia sp. WQ 349K1]QMW63867.1 outer membrane protein assembly factor BamE [Devosia sp. MC521]